MADLILDSRKKMPETHYFLFEDSRSAALPGIPRRAARARECPEAVGWTSPGGKVSFLRRLPKGGNRLAHLRGAVRQAAESMRKRGVASARFVFPAEADAFASALLPHLALADYSFDRYRSRKKSAKTLAIAVQFSSAPISKDDLSRARAVAEAVGWVRDLGNTPANDLGSREIVREVRELARREGLGFRSLAPAEIRRRKMGGVLGVSSGSSRPPAFIVLEHRPRAAKGRVVLVGKGVTFDAGGISIKPAASMGEMKFDMLGAATALGVVRAAHRLDLPVRLTALTPIVENVPSGTSYRPGDILRMSNGKTVEVDNTDAEGRLILADALTFAKEFEPDLIVDFATLTGAVVVSLGQECAGLMTEDDAVAEGLLDAGRRTGDRFWRLPLWDDYREQLKSDYADMKNVGGRWGGALTAAIFLKEFAPEGIPWAHCDIAGIGHLEKAHAGYAAGATGFGVAPVIEYLGDRFGGR